MTTVNNKRSLAIEIPKDPNSSKKVRPITTSLYPESMSHGKYQNALNRSNAQISPLPRGYVRGSSLSYLLEPANDSLPSAIIKPAFSDSSIDCDTTMWCYLEKIASIVSDRLDFGVPKTDVEIISTKFLPIDSPRRRGRVACSVQQFQPNMRNLHTCPPLVQKSILESQDPKTTKLIRRILLLDIILANSDRASPRNLLVNNEDPITDIVPIDHSLILDLNRKTNFYFLKAQAAHNVFSPAEKNWIECLNYQQVKQDIVKELPQTRRATLNTLCTTISFLKTGAKLGLSPFEIGSLMYKGVYEEQSFVESCFTTASNKRGRFTHNIQEELHQKMTPIALDLIQERPSRTIPSDSPDPRSPVLLRISEAVNDYADSKIS